MIEAVGSVHRSFRLSAATSALLDELAEVSDESRNSVVERLLGEAARTERHPLVRFRAGAAGRREPAIVGTRHLVRQVVTQLRAADGNVDEVAEYLGLPARTVRAALSYYVDFSDEVDDAIARANAFEADHRARWEREQAALA